MTATAPSAAMHLTNADEVDPACTIRFDDDGCPDGASVPKPWRVRESVSQPGRYR